MNQFEAVIAGRVKDNLPISVGTSLAIEALKDNVRYDSLWINTRTLYRNILHSVEDAAVRDRLMIPHHREEVSTAIATAISQEKNIIENYLVNKVGGVNLYLLGYKDLHRKFPNAKLKTPSTPKQKNYWDLMEAVNDKVLAADFDQDIRWDKGSELEGESTRSLIITNHPVDLLSRSKFRELRLLESHTGAIKPKSQWFTKLSDGRSLKNMPFNRFTIQIFGDGPLQFDRWNHKFRSSIVEMAHDNRWSPMTTMDRVRFCLDRMRDKYSGELLKRLL